MDGYTMIEVDRELLVTKLKARRAKLVADHSREMEDFPGKLDAWNIKLAGKLRDLADRLDVRAVSGITVNYRGDDTSVPIKMAPMPLKPKLDLCRIDRMIETVQLISKESFKLRSDDAILATAFPDKC